MDEGRSKPLGVCILDTAIRAERLPAGSLRASVSFVLPAEESGPVSPGEHGAHVARTVLAIAPFAQLVSVEVLDAHGRLDDVARLNEAFVWILEQAEALDIGVVCAAFADMSHRTSDAAFRGSPLQRCIAQLRDRGVPTVAPSGNWYARYRLTEPEGMAWPAILREVVSVGALDPAAAETATDFNSQRLQPRSDTGCGTTLFARPGLPGETSGAAAAVAGHLARLKRTRPTASVEALVSTLLHEACIVRDTEGRAWPALPD